MKPARWAAGQRISYGPSDRIAYPITGFLGIMPIPLGLCQSASINQASLSILSCHVCCPSGYHFHIRTNFPGFPSQPGFCLLVLG